MMKITSEMSGLLASDPDLPERMPDGLVKSLTGNIISRLSEAKLIIIGAKMVKVHRELAVKHYEHLQERPFFGELIDYLMGNVHKVNRVMAMVYEGEDAIKKIRDIVGDTDPPDDHRSPVGAARRAE